VTKCGLTALAMTKIHWQKLVEFSHWDTQLSIVNIAYKAKLAVNGPYR
jgi:hypothetical protein